MKAFAASNIGKMRQINEDSFLRLIPMIKYNCILLQMEWEDTTVEKLQVA